MSKYKPLLIESIREIRHLKERLNEHAPASREPIAIIGAGCRFPGASGPHEYWDFLQRGGDGVREIPPERWPVDEHFDPDPAHIGKIYARSAGFIDAIDQFDAGFFGISPREAVATDPQHRLLLEVACEALENAAIVPARLRGTRTGVYIGIMGQDYAHLSRDAQSLDLHTGIGNLPSVAAGRLAYWLGVHGPALSIDTACSSSLVAVHLACQNLRSGETDLALAGGVNLIVSPFVMMMVSAARMLAADGYCKTFDASADGFGRGEGCGIAVLKRLSDAQRDGDRILAVIRGSAINHDGRSAGLTVPSEEAQTSVIQQALADAGVAADAVQYLEAHGTGTSLGDPIEIAAAAQAYGADHKRAEALVVGSVKTNFGHLEGAAGIASLLKTALALRVGVIPPHLRLVRPNPHIDWANLAISVPLTAQPWPGSPSLRMAGVSSFGVSGTNAHVILSEPPPCDEAHSSVVPCRLLLALSAQTPQALRDKALDLLHYLRQPLLRDERLEHISYTLLFGRQHFEHRAAFVVAGFDDAIEMLEAFVQGRVDSRRHVGQVPRDLHASEAFQRFAQELAERSQQAGDRAGPLEEILLSLADLYCQGYEPDWPALFDGLPVRRIELPTYPFQRQRYWIEPASASAAALGEATPLHPLLHRNTSDFAVQRYTSYFDGSEFFLSDHLLHGQKVLPAVAYLEMARAAWQQACGGSPSAMRLRHVLWARPLLVERGPLAVHIGLYPQDDGAVAYQIYRDGEDGNRFIHSQGQIEAIEVAAAPRIDLAALREQCTQQQWSAAYCYERYAQVGLQYGAAQRAIEQLYLGDGVVLAQLRLPLGLASTREQFGLHPSLLDAALQSLLGLSSTADELEQTRLPFAFDELEVLGDFSERMWSVARFSTGSHAGDPLEKFDLQLCDEDGRVCASLKGFSARLFDDPPAAQAEPSAAAATLLWQPRWQPLQAYGGEAPGYAERVVLLCRGPLEVSRLAQRFGVPCEGLPEDYATQVERLLSRLQALIQSKPSAAVLLQVVVSEEGPQQVSAGLSGFLKSARLEHPKLIGQVITLGAAEDFESLPALLEDCSRQPQAAQIRYHAGAAEILSWAELTDLDAQVPWKDGGVYLITGGLGGLGRIFAKEIASQKNATTLVLTGRRSLDDAGRQHLRELEALGATVEYRNLDVADRDAVRQLVLYVQETYEGLNGILHSAGMIRDGLLLNKALDDLYAVLAPKVAGLRNLDEASGEIELDCFICFSSISSVCGNAGQSNYAAANGFMDAYARYRNALLAQGRRHGRTLSVNWPLWRDGGMQVDASAERSMAQATGLVAMSTAQGIQALYRAWASGLDQVAVLTGDPLRMQQVLQGPSDAMPANRSVAAQDAVFVEPSVKATTGLLENTGQYLRQLLAHALRLRPSEVEIEVPLEKYGIDSIIVMDLTRDLEAVFGTLSKTLFFEYQTLQALAGYFVEQHAVQLSVLLADKAPPSAPSSSVAAQPFALRRSARLERYSGAARPSADTPDRAIAIIGLAGRYPQAEDLTAFWSNLRAGKDCISEIPKARWDHSRYFDPDSAAVGKTYSKWGGFIDGVAEFDPLFFNISPREAELTDPQERLFLQCAYAVLEDAGYTRAALERYQAQGIPSNVGVYVGVMYEEYQLFAAQQQLLGNLVTVSASPTSIANRVSYCLNLHGPSMAVDTMCSSSLTAIHLACESIHRGDCEMAIAGGVNLSIHPNKYLLLGQGKFASSKGRCESFGDGGDGYVPGEGVGAVLLKPLSLALADGDHIYGVIKATALNHGGKTNGYTVPNPVAQTNVIAKAIKRAGIHPRAISYIEAHGTGTSLGDPIEITGLSKAFGEATQDRQYCAIGSVKSNIGHAESAAGIAGLTKVLLQMQHGQLVPSLHARQLNPHIDFSKTPFAVQQELTEWRRPQLQLDGARREYPRIAGISSFGAGGSNAHLIVAEYQPEVPAAGYALPAGQAALLVLSAKNAERLREQVRQLLAALERGVITARNLADAAYTLQVGREAMESRLALVSPTPEVLREQLRQVLQGEEQIDGVYRDEVKGHKQELASLLADDDAQRMLEAWLSKGKHDKLLELWVKGLSFDWDKLYGERKPRRISLPTYPFAKERYWLEEIAPPVAMASGVALLHPLLHRNTSDFIEQRYSSRFDGREFFLADHRVQGQRVLPGAAYLEMAREALRQASGEVPAGVRLKNVVWLRPLLVDGDPLDVHIGLRPQDDGSVNYEVYCATHDGEAVSYSQGRIEAMESTGEDRLDLAALRAQCRLEEWSGTACYERFARSGLDYGPAHRSIERLYRGEGQVLARLLLPASLTASASAYVLHPSLLDGALQSLLGLLSDSLEHDTRASLPFALERMEILGGFSERGWSVARFSAGSQASDRVQKFDIDLCDDDGRLCARLRGFTTRPLGNEPIASVGETTQTQLWQAQWQMSPAHQDTAVDYGEHLVLLCGGQADAQSLAAQLVGARCERLQSDYAAQAKTLLSRLQTLSRGHSNTALLVQVVVSNAGPEQLSAGLAGLLKSARRENPKLIGQVIETEGDLALEPLAAILVENAAHPQDAQIRQVTGVRQVLAWRELAESALAKPWKAGGVYLITGGLGGLGRLFSMEIAEQAPGATLVLTGRRELDETGRRQITALEALGATVYYRAVDVTDAQAVHQLVLYVREMYEALDGIVHSAGVLHDSLLLNKTSDQLEAVLAPKVAGLINLDKASQEIELDCFLCFSSIATVLGSPGQSDYAAANGFMDAYAHYRNGLVEQGLRHGHTLSLNWPLWRDGGMHMDASAEQAMYEATGLRALATASGIDALYRAWGSGLGQVLVLAGDPLRMRQGLAALFTPAAALAPVAPEPEDAAPAATVEPVLPKDNAVAYFKRLLAGTLKLPSARIEADAPLERYGIDSVMVTRLTADLEKSFGPLSKALLFEYQTVEALVEYFLANHRDALIGLLKLDRPRAGQAAQALAESAPPRTSPAVLRGQRNRFALAGSVVDPTPAQQPRDIAIVGLAGRYPQANDLKAFWDNLRAGKDCITEVPNARWDHRLYFDPDKNRPGTTYSKWGGFIDGVDEFDPLFFNISPREAELIDPQERLFLQCVHGVLEDAGYTRETLEQCSRKRMIGVYAGVFFEEYSLYGAQEQAKGNLLALGGGLASIANRVSYYFNLHGPSLSVDSMCSSSLTAIHLASESIRRGECELAIAGGVNVSIHPNKYLLLARGKFASSRGRCESFGAHGDGYVPGEGVGAVLLKSLEQAIADGDHIYGVIKASALNHGGKTNGYTVPNPAAQTEVIVRALQESGIDARTLSYLEAHGTGTSLGDPIEIDGLSKAFAASTRDRQYCAIGSVKSNIGHCEGAAGIAGLTKVLLQMQHGQLVPSLHSHELNPNIDFAQTPFVVQQELAEWKRPVLEIAGQAREIPRRAGISSFGAGGSNAHLIVEEYLAEPQRSAEAPPGPLAVLLSARDEQRLKEQVRQLLSALCGEDWDDGRLLDMAYTLQVGREAMEERLALQVETAEDLRSKLAQYLDGQDGVEGLYRDRVKPDRSLLSAFATDEDLAGALKSWLAKGKLEQVLELWVQGLRVDWSELYGEPKPRRISLPTYPFARERYWLQREGHAQVVADVLHPLLQRNTSDLSEQRFSSRFSGNEFFLIDHLLQGKSVLPGVAYWEMAREALVQGAGVAPGAWVRLKEVVWLRPLVVDGSTVELHLGLYPDADGTIGFEVYSGEEQVHSQGRAEVFTADVQTFDLEGLREQCQGTMLSGAACYERFAALGLTYGPAHRAIEQLHLGTGRVLAQLALPLGVASTCEQYVLHPSLLDAALQSVLGLSLDAGQGQLALPFSVREVEIRGACTPRMWALAQRSTGAQTDDRVQTFDIDLCTDDGVVAVRIKGFSTRLVDAGLGDVCDAPRRAEALTDDQNSAHRPLLDDQARHYFKRLLAETFKLPVERIDAGLPLERYGINSVLVMQLIAELEKSFGTLSKTLLFEYQTLNALLGYFLEHHRAQLIELLEAAAEPLAKVSDSSTKAATCLPLGIPALGTARRRRERFALAPATSVSPQAKPDIAIIGLSGCYPQARDLKAFWANLCAGKDCITEIPSARWDHRLYFDADKHHPGTTYSKWGGFIDGVDEFDPRFFHISLREARIMDPQERLFLQCVHAALEDAGYTHESLGRDASERAIGVYAGVFFEEYPLYGAEEQAKGNLLALGGGSGSIANRVSYYFDLHGPSLSVNSMCSSSLTALHLACESLQKGRCRMAIAGGVNVTVHPNKYLLLAQGKFVSSKGRCESFGVGGDGYVPGEGVGAVLLKPLEQAIADGDHIYAVIKAAAINHGGKTNGYTVPNPVAQAQVIRQALNEAGIDARTISYVEAHGTGTSLGDPIEITGLSKAFAENTADRQYCAIGSVKSNIGHCEGAAGMAGLTKVLLQMQHGQLVPSLHSRELNPNIDFARTPFVVQQELAQWQRPVLEIDGVRKEYPRRAGLSSFGAGGANAHVIVEEYLPPPRESGDAHSAPLALVLSAKNGERLREYAERLLATLSEENWPDERLADMAYTLQVGREALEERLAWLADTPEELKSKLAGYLAGRNDIEGLYRGQALALTAEANQPGAPAGSATGTLAQLLEGWVQGLHVDWSELYGERKPRRISLPTYPFAREKYWVPQREEQAHAPTQVLHPLLQRDTSELSKQRFSSCFSGNEFFLADHLLQGKSVLPGVAYWEMAREALVHGAGVAPGASVRLKDVVWLRPFVVADSPRELHLELSAEADGTMGFEIYSGAAQTHSQGRAENFMAAAETLDLDALRGQCNGAALSASACYERFAALGLAYGPAHRALEQMYLGTGQVLARLVLPVSVASTRELYVLHPSLLDAALQSVLGLSWPAAQDHLALPFSVGEVEILGGCAERMWAWTRLSPGSQADDLGRRFDIDLCADDGVVAVRIKGFSTRLVEGGRGSNDALQTLLWWPSWENAAPSPTSSQVAAYDERLVLLGDSSVDVANLSARLGVPCERLPNAYEAQAERLLQRLQAVMRSQPKASMLLQVVVSNKGPEQLSMGLAGLLKSAGRENPNLLGQVIALDADEGLDPLLTKLEENATHPLDTQIRYAAGCRQVVSWRELTDTLPAKPWKAGGVYLITGGLGGLGQIFAQEIAAQAAGVTLVLTGRRTLDEPGWRQVRALEALGATVQYRTVDVADAAAVRQLLLLVQEEHGGVQGILHSAGVLRDGLLLYKTPDELAAVLAPKVSGVLNLDEASREIELDWFICFSSIAALFGNLGQSDYAAGNAFMDAYAHYRNALVQRGLRYGRTLSLNWPLWAEGGMRIDAAAEQMMTRTTGLLALSTPSGIDAFYRAWASGYAQVAVMAGEPSRLRQALRPASATPTGMPERLERTQRHSAVMDCDAHQALPLAEQKAGEVSERPDVAYLDALVRAALAKALGMAAEDLPGNLPLQTLGYNSIVVMELKYRLETTLQRSIAVEQLSDAGGTISELVQRLGETLHAQADLEEAAEAPVQPVLLMRPEARFEPFPLTEMQEAFLLGQHSSIDSDRIGAHIYVEIEVQGALDIFRLNRAWNQLVAGHDMLRAVIGGGNQQRILESVRDYRFKVVDLRRLTQAERDRKADALREKLEYRLYGEDEWPRFEIQVAIEQEGRYRIHFSISEMAADAQSMGTLLRQWGQLYTDPDYRLPAMQLTFRDYVLAMKAFEQSSTYQRDLAYWLERLQHLPNGPQLPKPAGDVQAATARRRTRLHYQVSAADWQALKHRAALLEVSPTALMLGVFAEVLRAWSAQPTFTLVLTYFNRLPLHAQIRELIGPAISSLLLVVEPRDSDDFDSLIQNYDRRLGESLEHSSVSGIKALRQLRGRRGSHTPLMLPVVFTSLLGSELSSTAPGHLGEVAYIVNQTPQVYLDHQLRETAEGLEGSWDVAQGHFAPGLIRALFAAYLDAVNGLAKGQWSWPLATTDSAVEQGDAVALLTEFVCEAQREDPLAPFPLTDQQQAYAFGRDPRFEGGGTSCQVYQELLTDHLDVARLQQALNTLIVRHPMLRTIVDGSGTQSMQVQVPDYVIQVSDLGRMQPAQRQLALTATRDALLERVQPLDQWPYFTVTVSLLEEERACVHLCFDLLIVDSTCIGLLLDEWLRLYEQPQTLPPAPEMTFRDYQRAVERLRGTARHAECLGYWKHKFLDLPSGPLLPQSPLTGRCAGQHQRISAEFWQWSALKRQAEARGIAPSLILLTAYLEVLFAWSDEQPLAVVVPGWERLPVHADIERVIGDFTTLSWVTREAQAMSFEARLAQVARQHAQDLAQRPVSGLQALRRVTLKDRQRQARFPVVFTNQIMASASPEGRFALGQAISRTPQVYLDNISSEAGSRLHCSWDFASDIYASRMIEEMFDGYLRLLECLVSDAQAWQCSDFNALIRARAKTYQSMTGVAISR